MKKIGIITINFNTEDLLKKLIDCLEEQSYRNWVLLIVNNSPDNTEIIRVIESFNDSRIILGGNNKNLGYSRGNNLGFRYLTDNKIIGSGDLVLFTNEDIIIRDSSFLKRAVEEIDKLKCGFMGPKVINNDGSLMLPHVKKAGFLKCLLHMGNNGKVDKIFKINRSLRNVKSPRKVFLLNGACFLCRAGDFDKIGMFDTNTFIYYEEELLFRRVSDGGIDVFYNPGIQVYHEHSASVKKSFSIINKKKFVYDGELYFLTRILKINRFQLFMFKFERAVEFLLLKTGLFIRPVK
ncbi:MAG: glycosyltransferase family 2 protein [Actinomycetota bacterium]|nr:glycosyltransferase family 2 protein [Actinomycetota bacterium]